MDQQCNCLHKAAAHEVYTLCDLQLSSVPALLEKLDADFTVCFGHIAMAMPTHCPPWLDGNGCAHDDGRGRQPSRD